MGYVFNHSAKYMHQLISTEAQIPNFQNMNLSVDHIDRIKIDNRVKNLRMASQSEQNSNRDTRSDKKAPSEELTNAGISELPKYVRWDNSETKFVIDKHPQLIQEALGGKRKKAQMSGSKSSKLSIIEKYQDILARLEELDMNMYDPEFKELIKKNKKEYDDICKCIQTYEGNEPIPTQSTLQEPIPLQPPLQETTPSISANRNTAPGRKAVSKLP